MGSTLVLPEAIAEELACLARSQTEMAGVLIVGQAHGERPRLLGRAFVRAPEGSYAEQAAEHLSLTSLAWAPALARAEAMGGTALFVHSHPLGDPEPSTRDRRVDGLLSEPFRIRTGSDCYGSLVLSPSPDPPGFRFTGHLQNAGAPATPIMDAFIVGRRIRLMSAHGTAAPVNPPESYDRQIRAFGGAVQSTLGQLHIGVVGAGGTGSAVAEALVRLGVRNLTIADPDLLEPSNVTRVYGSHHAQAGLPKVEVQKAHLEALFPGVAVRAIPAPCTARSVAQALAQCHVVFGCTDDEAGRLVLSRLSSFYLLPVFDCGVLLSSRDGQLTSIDGRVTTMIPGHACLICRGRIDLARATAETMSTSQLEARQREGYAPELGGGADPAVVAYTASVAALAVAELIERLTGHGPDPGPTELIVRFHDREISTNRREPARGHFCHPDTNLLGVGDVDPFLLWTWPETAQP